MSDNGFHLKLRLQSQEQKGTLVTHFPHPVHISSKKKTWPLIPYTRPPQQLSGVSSTHSPHPENLSINGVPWTSISNNQMTSAAEGFSATHSPHVESFSIQQEPFPIQHPHPDNLKSRLSLPHSWKNLRSSCDHQQPLSPPAILQQACGNFSNTSPP